MAYKDRVTSMCSYGTNRKLSTALALIGNPSILLLVRNGGLVEGGGAGPWAARRTWTVSQNLLRHSLRDTAHVPVLGLTTDTITGKFRFQQTLIFYLRA